MNKSNVCFRNVGIAVALSASFAVTALAGPITGTVQIGQGSVGVTNTAIDFFGGPPTCASPNPGSPGCFSVSTGTGSFASAISNTGNNTIQDLIGPPPGGSIFLPGFMVFNNGVVFDLTAVPPAGLPLCSSVSTTAGGVTCVPSTVSPFRLTNGPGSGPGGTGPANTVGVQLTLDVNGYTGSPVGASPYVGVFTTQFSGENIQDILNQLAAGGGTGEVSNSYSATFSPAGVPEPSSMLLMGLGLAGMTFMTRRLRAR